MLGHRDDVPQASASAKRFLETLHITLIFPGTLSLVVCVGKSPYRLDFFKYDLTCSIKWNKSLPAVRFERRV